MKIIRSKLKFLISMRSVPYLELASTKFFRQEQRRSSTIFRWKIMMSLIKVNGRNKIKYKATSREVNINEEKMLKLLNNTIEVVK